MRQLKHRSTLRRIAMAALVVVTGHGIANADDSLERARRDGVTYAFSNEPPGAYMTPDGKAAGTSSEMVLAVLERIGVTKAMARREHRAIRGIDAVWPAQGIKDARPRKVPIQHILLRVETQAARDGELVENNFVVENLRDNRIFGHADLVRVTHEPTCHEPGADSRCLFVAYFGARE